MTAVEGTVQRCPTLAGAVPRKGDSTTIKWVMRHMDACAKPEPGLEAALVIIASGVTLYVDALLRSTEDGAMPGDYILNRGLGAMLNGFIVLLQGDHGRLDQGTACRWARKVAELIRYDLDAEAMLPRGAA